MDETYNDATTELVAIAIEQAQAAFWGVADRLYGGKFSASSDLKVDAAEAHRIVDVTFTKLGEQLTTYIKGKDPVPMTWEVAEKVLGSLGAETLQIMEMFTQDDSCSEAEFEDVMDLITELNGAATLLHHRVSLRLD